jgi:hypothetical protein
MASNLARRSATSLLSSECWSVIAFPKSYYGVITSQILS